jgi:hypothetical protein
MAGDEPTSDQFARWWRETGENELRQLLFWRWDPVGVADYFPNTADEYDLYAPQLVQVLREGGDAGAIAAHLRDIERQRMDGPLTSKRRLRDVGSLIRDWYDTSYDSWSAWGPPRG